MQAVCNLNFLQELSLTEFAEYHMKEATRAEFPRAFSEVDNIHTDTNTLKYAVMYASIDLKKAFDDVKKR